MIHKKKFLIIVVFLQSWIFFSFLLTTNAHTENSNLMTTQPSLKTSSNKVIVRILDDTQVNYNTTGDQFIPSICALSNDTFAVAWSSEGQDGSSWGVYASVFNATSGKNITSEFRVNHHTDKGQGSPSICALSSDIFAVAWVSDEQDGDGSGIFARVFDATTGNNITAEFQVNQAWGSDQTKHSICALSSDTFAVAWKGAGEYASVFNATTGQQIIPEFKVNTLTIDQFSPNSICALSDDMFAVAWAPFDMDLYDIRAKVFNATTGDSITSRILINNYTFLNQARPSICSLSDDKFAVAWYCHARSGVYTRVFNVTTEKNITSEFLVGGGMHPSISALSNDIFAVAWSNQDGSVLGVYAEVFNASTGKSIIPEFQVNQYTENSQVWPSVCALSNDTFVIAWTSEGQDGDQYGVYCSIFRIENYYPSILLPSGSGNGNGGGGSGSGGDGSIPFGSLYFAVFLISVLSLVIITRYKILKKGGKK